MLRELTVSEFSTSLSSDEPAPGGGSASAAVAAFGAGLLIMTCNFTIGKDKYADVEEEMRELLDELEPIRVWLLASIDRDSVAYNAVVEAFKMPKGTPEEKTARKEAIQVAMRGAAEVPLDVARRCARALDLASMVVEMGNPNTLSDAGCGARFVDAGLRGALYNVRINLGSIKDEDYVARAAAEVKDLSTRADAALAKVLNMVESGL
ncbi:MAG: cyclodeaminase/cyclohydrolase family protein [Thermoplasmata archaeon]|nr:cyclodeaminase/cyclohydrolase family protein [Thermoplasmata archaeon]